MSKAGQRPRLSDVLYADLLQEIHSGKYGAGTRLPSEADFSAQFGVSRPIVREALGRLREEGIIRSKKGSGSYVAAAERRDGVNGGAAARTVSSISDVQKLYQFRVSLEGEAAFLAAQNRTDEQLEAIAKAAADLASTMHSASDGTNEDIIFHRAVALATGNAFFVEVLDRIAPDMQFIVQLARTLLQGRPAKNIEAVQREHSLVLEAIRRGDAVAARERMQFHIRTAQARLFFGETVEGSALWQQSPPM
ncbi:FadR family transcriptional regulator [Rhizobium sp. TRM96647]|uniref:FadR/GntR family transcriptional regulator n=1 Tax=unclassified Rhizobium TaxID=2613769 RepID=UPI0021E89D83|nr:MULTISPECIES: FadR/GntR family transcriptional regulator [unclassified Rhizobium]MCV3737326.1 FadR family transcriptional regulator [Rhizobium sp. TRM96647]MCV3759310.1 FadR family transcriptional regulator [Rhizobium sp. TRM96650]